VVRELYWPSISTGAVKALETAFLMAWPRLSKDRSRYVTNAAYEGNALRRREDRMKTTMGSMIAILAGTACMLYVCCYTVGVAAQIAQTTPLSVSPGQWADGFQLQAELVELPASREGGESGLPYEPILRLTFQNATNETLVAWESSAENDYDLTVRNASGHLVPAISRIVDVSWNNLRQIQPGDALVSDYHLTQMYGLLADGEYTITARRGALRFDGEGAYLIESNAVVVAVSSGRMSQLFASTVGGAATAKAPTASTPQMVAARPVLERHL
jgi:hypothetical protein